MAETTGKIRLVRNPWRYHRHLSNPGKNDGQRRGFIARVCTLSSGSSGLCNPADSLLPSTPLRTMVGSPATQQYGIHSSCVVRYPTFGPTHLLPEASSPRLLIPQIVLVTGGS